MGVSDGAVRVERVSAGLCVGVGIAWPGWVIALAWVSRAPIVPYTSVAPIDGVAVIGDAGRLHPARIARNKVKVETDSIRRKIRDGIKKIDRNA
jgi:hypothetical protein